MVARLIVPAFVWSVAMGIGTWLFFNVTPSIEARVFPVLTKQYNDVEQGDRSVGQICWTWHWNKTRHAQPLVLSWTIIVNGTVVEFPAVTRRERDGSVIRDPQPAALGPGQNDLCTTIPATIDKERDLTVRGVIGYRVPHGLWTIWQDLPPVVVPPLAN